MDAILESYLDRQFANGMELAAGSDILRLAALDGPPAQHYVACYAATGLVKDAAGRVVEAEGFDVGIWLPDDYLRQADCYRTLTYLGPHPRPWHPNIRPPAICVHLRPGMPLVDLLYVCFELWTYGLYATGDNGLNPAASQWVRRQDPRRFPLCRRPLKRRTLDLSLTQTGGSGPS